MIIFKALKYIFYILVHRPRGWANLILNQATAFLRLAYAPALPTYISIEPTNLCDQKCPVCETGLGILNRPRGLMSLENFKRIIDKIYKHTNGILLYFMGETFLNKDAYEMIKYAKSKNIFVEACTNGNVVDGKKLVDSGIDEIQFQIGGTTQEIHQIYRVGGNLEKAINNIKATVERKKETGAGTKIILGLIVMRHNEHQIEDFWKLAKALGVDRGEIVNPCVRNRQDGERFLPKNKKYWIYDKELFSKEKILKMIKSPRNSCWWIWHTTVITWDGNVVPCCRDPKAEYIMGNIFEENLKDIWNNKKYRAFRKQILNNQKNIPICRLCSGYALPYLR